MPTPTFCGSHGQPQVGSSPTRACVSAKAAFRRDQDVAVQRQFQPAGDGRAVDRPDHRLGRWWALRCPAVPVVFPSSEVRPRRNTGSAPVTMTTSTASSASASASAPGRTGGAVRRTAFRDAGPVQGQRADAVGGLGQQDIFRSQGHDSQPPPPRRRRAMCGTSPNCAAWAAGNSGRNRGGRARVRPEGQPNPAHRRECRRVRGGGRAEVAATTARLLDARCRNAAGRRRRCRRPEVLARLDARDSGPSRAQQAAPRRRRWRVAGRIPRPLPGLPPVPRFARPKLVGTAGTSTGSATRPRNRWRSRQHQPHRLLPAGPRRATVAVSRCVSGLSSSTPARTGRRAGCRRLGPVRPPVLRRRRSSARARR